MSEQVRDALAKAVSSTSALTSRPVPSSPSVIEEGEADGGDTERRAQS